MLWKCCTQYASKFGKLGSSHRTGKGQFSFQSQRKAMPKNTQTTAQLHSSHRLKFSKPGFSNTSTVNFQMFKLVLERQRNQRSNCQHLLDHRESKRVPEKQLLLLYWLHQRLCGSQNCGKFLKRREYQATWTSSWQTCMQIKEQQLDLDREQQTGSKLGKSMSRLYTVTLLI